MFPNPCVFRVSVILNKVKDLAKFVPTSENVNSFTIFSVSAAELNGEAIKSHAKSLRGILRVAQDDTRHLGKLLYYRLCIPGHLLLFCHITNHTKVASTAAAPMA